MASSGQKVTFRVTFRVTLGGDPESHFLVTFELLCFFRGFGGSRGYALSRLQAGQSETSARSRPPLCLRTPPPAGETRDGRTLNLHEKYTEKMPQPEILGPRKYPPNTPNMPEKYTETPKCLVFLGVFLVFSGICSGFQNCRPGVFFK